jgi:hypothetical protein
MIKVYLSGPINSDVGDGLDKDDHKEAFADLARWLKQNYGNWEVVNPCEVGPNCKQMDCGPFDGHSFGCWLKADLKAMLDCDAICFLPFSDRSMGARLEGHVAQGVGMDTYYATPIGATSWRIDR